jgi:hypothetical protein
MGILYALKGEMMAYDNLSYEVSALSHNLEVVANNISVISSQVSAIDDKVDGIDSTLQMLNEEFAAFRIKYTLDIELQLAETRIINVRQKIEKEFGHYDEVRRHTTGILQAVDASLVRQETIKNATEELMLATPRYWLSPCLIALSSWINNDQTLAQKAMFEGIRRNDEKTSLFFSLVSRRGNRYNASRMWLDRYLSMQNPATLPRDMVVVVDAYSNGIFGPDIDGLCMKRFRGWIDVLSARQGFEDQQRTQWKNALLSVGRSHKSDEYTYLKKYSSTWPLLEKALSGAHLHISVYDYFSSMFNEKVKPAIGINDAVDGILDTLVSEYDNDELRLRNEERLLSLIIEENGNKPEAQKRFDLEKDTATETVDFTQVLTNAAIHPEVVYSSRACQRLSVALSKEWIIRAHQELKAENRASVPHTIDFIIDSWSGATVDGGNEEELTKSIKSYFDQEVSKAIVNIKIGLIHWAAAIGGGILLLWGLATMNVLGIVLGAGGLIWFYMVRKNIEKRKQQIKDQFSQHLTNVQKIVKALLAEVVDWRSAFSKEDANSEKVEVLLETVSAEQFVGCSYDAGRAVRISK